MEGGGWVAQTPCGSAEEDDGIECKSQFMVSVSKLGKQKRCRN